MRVLALILVAILAGCGTFKCDCGDGRAFSMSRTESATQLALNCNMFCEKKP